MPRHESVEATLIDIFSQHKIFFEEMAESKYPMDVYRNAFISLHEKGLDIHHFEECFESLRQASQEARSHLAKYQKPEVHVEDLTKVIGGETELRQEINKRLFPKTVARATLYNYLTELAIRKDTYTQKELQLVVDHILSLKKERKS